VKKLHFALILVAFVMVGLVVWLAPSYKPLDIHDVATFRFVLMLGAGQTFVAIYGGWLAVLALESKDRPPHEIFFVFLGLILFGLTFYVGILNDKSQYDIQSKLDRSYSLLAETRGAIREFTTLFSPAKTSPPHQALRPIDPDRAQRLLSELTNLDQNISKLLPPSFTQNPLPLDHSHPGEGTPPVTPISEKLKVMNDLEGFSVLKGMDGGVRSRLQMIMHKIPRGPADLENRGTLNSDDERSLQGDLDERTRRFKEILPPIQVARSEAQTFLNMTEKEKAEDNQRFETLSAELTTPRPITTPDRHLAPTPYVSDNLAWQVGEYLEQLRTRVEQSK
jgi:hypothetical protein